MRPWTHKLHHGPNSGEATTFPHIVFFAPLRGTYIRMIFCPGTPKEKSRNCAGLDLHTLRGHNSLFRPPIGTRPKENL
jgi:hypothetical protein